MTARAAQLDQRLRQLFAIVGTAPITRQLVGGERRRSSTARPARSRPAVVEGEVDPATPVVGDRREVPLIDTFQEPVAAVCVGACRPVACDTSSGLQRVRLTRWDSSMRLAILVVRGASRTKPDGR
jgi:hypothetical protein